MQYAAPKGLHIAYAPAYALAYYYESISYIACTKCLKNSYYA